MPSAAEAHQKLLQRKWEKGESVEALYYSLSDLWKLSLGRDDPKEDSLFVAVTPFFLGALPVQVSTQLRMSGVGSNVDELLKQARVLVTILSDKDNDDPHSIGAFNYGKGRGKGKGKAKGFKPNGVRCFRCGEDHFAKNCSYPGPVCYSCKKAGHTTDNCREKQQARAPKNALAGKSVSWPDLPESQ